MKKKTLPEVRIYTNVNDTKYALFEQPEVISDAIREDGFWNKTTLMFATNLLKKQPKGLVIDIGSGFGTFTIPIACTFADKYDIVSFEPIKPIFLQLATNVLINNLGQVKVYNVGLSDKSETIVSNTLDIHHSGNHGSFSFDEETNALRNIVPTAEKDTYDMRTLDSYKLTNVRFVKLSAAGMETKVLEGAKETLKNNNLPPVLFEFWDAEWYIQKRDAIFEFLKSMGYGHFENLFGYVFAFKDRAEYDFFASEEEVIESGEFVISQKVHVTKDTLEDQKVYGQD